MQWLTVALEAAVDWFFAQALAVQAIVAVVGLAILWVLWILLRISVAALRGAFRGL